MAQISIVQARSRSLPPCQPPAPRASIALSSPHTPEQRRLFLTRHRARLQRGGVQERQLIKLQRLVRQLLMENNMSAEDAMVAFQQFDANEGGWGTRAYVG